MPKPSTLKRPAQKLLDKFTVDQIDANDTVGEYLRKGFSLAICCKNCPRMIEWTPPELDDRFGDRPEVKIADLAARLSCTGEGGCRSEEVAVREAPQADLFGADAPLLGPEGFRYQANLLTPAEEAKLVRELAALPFEPFDFHGHLAHRQVVGFGYRYDYASRTVRTAAAIPAFLDPLRFKVAAFAGKPPEAFEQVLINEYRPGAGIGWHRDKPHFEEVVGVSLLAPCTFRFRKKAGERWERLSLPIEPRSAYLMTGPSRHVWEHSVRPLEQHRYSITMRTLAGKHG